MMRFSGIVWWVLFLFCFWACGRGAEEKARLARLEKEKQVKDSLALVAKYEKAKEDSIFRVLRRINGWKKAEQLDSLWDQIAGLYRFNGSVLIAQSGQVLYRRHVGFSNYKKRIPLSDSSVFQLASSSKPFTALAIMMLKERGLLNYDDLVQKHIPEFPYSKITIRMLLSHRSGLPNYMYFCELMYCCPDVPISNYGVVDLMVCKKPDSYYKPNAKFKYCNTNYCLLANIIERVSKQPFNVFLQKNIFDPLNMKHTYVWNGDTAMVIPHRVTGYNPDWTIPPDNYLDGVMGDKGIFSTAEDLFKFDQALYTDKLVRQSTLNESYQPYSKDIKGGRNYGLGWRLLNYKDSMEKIVYHNGWWHGFNNVFTRRLRDSTTVIILSNHKSAAVYNTQKIWSILNQQDTKGEEEEMGEE